MDVIGDMTEALIALWLLLLDAIESILGACVLLLGLVLVAAWVEVSDYVRGRHV